MCAQFLGLVSHRKQSCCLGVEGGGEGIEGLTIEDLVRFVVRLKGGRRDRSSVQHSVQCGKLVDFSELQVMQVVVGS